MGTGAARSGEKDSTVGNTLRTLILEGGLEPGVQLIPLPQLGKGAALQVNIVCLATHPDTKSALRLSKLTAQDGSPIYTCETTGRTDARPSELGSIIAYLLGWVKGGIINGQAVHETALPPGNKIRITIEVLEEGMDMPENTSSSIVAP